jgi:hypothetical protein
LAVPALAIQPPDTAIPEKQRGLDVPGERVSAVAGDVTVQDFS